jgi:hypothetical protein
MAGPCVSYDRDGIRSFCEMLAALNTRGRQSTGTSGW